MEGRRDDFNNQPYYNQTHERRQQANNIAFGRNNTTRNIHCREPFPNISVSHCFGMQPFASNELQARLNFINTDVRLRTTQSFGYTESHRPSAPVPLMGVNCNPPHLLEPGSSHDAGAFSGANQPKKKEKKKATVDQSKATRGTAKSPQNRCRSGSISSIASDASTSGSQQLKHRASISGEKMIQKVSKKIKKKNKETKGGHAAGKSAATSNCAQVHSEEPPDFSTVSNLSNSSSDSQATSSSSSCSTMTNNTSFQPKRRNKKRNRRSSEFPYQI